MLEAGHWSMPTCSLVLEIGSSNWKRQPSPLTAERGERQVGGRGWVGNAVAGAHASLSRLPEGPLARGTARRARPPKPSMHA
jgi:hypothetical protein